VLQLLPVMNEFQVERMSATRSRRMALVTAALLVAGCGGSESSGLTKDMQIVEAGNGFGLLLPHRVLTLDSSGQPSTQITAIRTMADLMANVTPSNRVLPTTPFESDAILSTGEAGNHYIYMRFTQPLDLSSIFDQSPSASVNSNLGGQVSLVATDPDSGTTTSVSARIFVNGVTVGRTAVDGLLPFETWVQANGSSPIALDVDGSQPGLGFPGTTSAFQGASGLVRPDTLVAIADSDDDLSTFETFPVGVQIKLRAGNVLSETGNALVSPGLACATVGLDDIQPEVAISTDGLTSLPKVGPTDGDLFDVDPQTSLRIELSEPVQPTSLGRLDNGQPAGASSAIIVTFGPQQSLTTVPFTVRPFSVFDLSIYELIPGFTFPGTGPALAECGDFSQVSISVTPQQIEDLSSNLNTQSAANSFETGEGPGLANAPVAPDVVYIGRVGSDPGISVIDLNGFGASTGSPAYDPLNPIVQGNSNYPNNPNVKIQGNVLVPALAAGTCTFNGGSQGVFTLTRDSSLNDKLVRKPLIDAVGDMMIGQALDLSFNNGPPPFGCQAGTPNICASSGLKQPSGTAFGNGLAPAQPGQFSTIPPGVGNIIAWAPHPNPPPLVFPPPCVSPLIAGQEPTSIDSTVPPNAKLNLLSPSGDPFGSPDFNVPPSGLLTNTQNAYFQGPSLPQPVITSCSAYSIRQQVGHFLYMIDRVSREVVVLNSNRFTVIDRIPLPDPTSLAMSPNADLLAVSNRGANLVSLIDIDPNSGTFHQVIKSVTVGAGPSGIAWQPDNEDILVCNELDDSLSIISTFSLAVRKTVNTTLDRPFEIAVAPRQGGFGTIGGFHLNRQVYFAYVLQRNGRVSLYESGPSGPSGVGTDTVIGQAPLTFKQPKKIAIDVVSLTSSFYVLHEEPLDTNGALSGVQGGAITQVRVTGSQGAIPLTGQSQFNLNNRDVQFQIILSKGPETLTGVPVDLAFDNQVNRGGTLSQTSQFSPSVPAPVNNKNMISTGGLASYTPRFMFVAVPNSSEGTGAVDVLELAGGLNRFDVNVFEDGVQSVRASGATFLSDYWKQ
jgi:YVTN family beta-propeller protein